MLRFELSDKDRRDYGRRQADLVTEIDGLNDSKKASAAQYKADIELREGELRSIASRVRSGHEERRIKCQWRFECAGLEADGTPIYHPEKKALIRLDSDVVVEVRDITDEERQISLPLDESEQPEDTDE